MFTAAELYLPPFRSPSSPDHTRAYSRLSRLHGIDTPLGSYVHFRKTHRADTTSTKVPLSSLVPLSVKKGATGGSFKPAIKIKYVPMTAQASSSAQLTHRGIRNVPLHSERYNPTGQRVGPLTSLLHLGRPLSRQHNHMIQRINYSSEVKMRKQNHTPFQHRTDHAFYMNGLGANLHSRDTIPDSVIDRYKLHPPSQNAGLYYGKGLSQSHDAHHSKALDKYRDRLKQQSDIININLDLSLLEDYPLHYTNRANTPASPLLTSTSPSAAMATKEHDLVVSGKRTFVTEGVIDEEPQTNDYQ